jgi:hypothetical protein
MSLSKPAFRATDLGALSFFPSRGPSGAAEQAGFRFGEKGTHSSRTIMLTEFTAALAAIPGEASRGDYATAIVSGNCLAKTTSATRRLTNQRLGELYALDPASAIFRVLRRLWARDEPGRPLLALLAALARDPLLRATAQTVVLLPMGGELPRALIRAALHDVVGERFNDAVLDKVVRNAASSWAQAGHLQGRTFKVRRRVEATPGAVAFALYLGHLAGFRSEELLTSGWSAILDCSPTSARSLALEAKRMGLIDLRGAGDVFEVGLERLDPAPTRR